MARNTTGDHAMTDEEWNEMEAQGVRDLEEFERLLPGLLREHLDEHVLIHGGRLVGFYPDRSSAADAGCAIANGRGYFVKRIHPDAAKPIRMIARPA